MPSRPSARTSRSPRPAPSTSRRTGSRARAEPATSYWGWAGGKATGSHGTCSNDWIWRPQHDDARPRHRLGPARALWACLGDIRRRRVDGAVHGRCRIFRGSVRRSDGRAQCPSRVPARGGRTPAGRGVHRRTPLGRAADRPCRLARELYPALGSRQGSARRVHDDGDRGRWADRPVPRVVAPTGVGRHRLNRRRCMAGDISFDVVSDFDEQELRNALDQVRREVSQRYDFKDVTVDLTQNKTDILLVTDDEYRAAAVKDLIESKAIRRDLSLKIFDWGKVEPSGGNKVRQEIKLRRGLTDDVAKRITKLIRDEFPKVKSQIQGDAVRVSGKSRDELQKVIARLRELDEPVPLQFQNYR